MNSKNSFILNPRNQTENFGLIPNIKVGHDEFSRGYIKLRVGQHIGPNRGFGVKHIWQEHKNQLIKQGYRSIEDVATHISDIIIPNAPIYCEFNDYRGNHRLAIIRTSKGVVYVEKKFDGQNNIFYSVITAFKNKKAHGTRIGSVC